jgi:serine/threonine protein kinase
MLFVMLTGYFPFKGTSDEELYARINEADYPRHDPVLTKRPAHLLARMFAPLPEERISAEAVPPH